MYNAIDIKNRIIRALKSKGVSIQPTLVEIGLAKSTLDKNNVSMPKADTLARIADYLGCSVDYLLGRPADGITAEERQLLEHFRACSDDDRKYIRRLASTFAAEEIAEKAKREG